MGTRRGEDSPEELVALDAELRLRGLHRLLLVAGVVRHRAGLLSRQLPRFPGGSFVRVSVRSSSREGWLRVSPSQGPESGAASLEQSPSLGANRVRNLVSFASAQNLLTGVCYVRSPPPSHQHHHHLVLSSLCSLPRPQQGEFNGSTRISLNSPSSPISLLFISRTHKCWGNGLNNDG